MGSTSGSRVVYVGVLIARPMYGAHTPSCTKMVQNVVLRWPVNESQGWTYLLRLLNGNVLSLQKRRTFSVQAD
jgi:hypothetical protein